MPADFPHFEVMDPIMGGRTAVTPMHLLDSAASTTVEAESDNEVTTEVANQSITSFLVVNSQSTTPGPAVRSCPSTPGPAVSSCPSAPAPAVSTHLLTPSLPDDDSPIAKETERG